MFGKLKDYLNAGFLKLLRPIARKGVIKLVQVEGDKLQAKVNLAIAQQGPDAVDKLFDSWQGKLLAGINTLKFLPEFMRHGAVVIIQDEGDKLQAMVKDAALKSGPIGVDAAFDFSQNAIIERVNAL